MFLYFYYRILLNQSFLSNIFHSTSKFNKKTGEKLGKGKKDYSKVFGEKLVELSKENKKIDIFDEVKNRDEQK